LSHSFREIDAHDFSDAARQPEVKLRIPEAISPHGPVSPSDFSKGRHSSNAQEGRLCLLYHVDPATVHIHQPIGTTGIAELPPPNPLNLNLR
jgi:hypothetical protein